MKKRQAIIDYLDQHQDEIVRTLSQLIQIDSQNQGMPDTAQEGPAQEFVFNLMQTRGFPQSGWHLTQTRNVPTFTAPFLEQEAVLPC